MTKNAVKVRLSIIENLYSYRYFNQRYGTTNYTVILDDERIYGRDCYDGNWHLHLYEDPSKHDTSEKGRRMLSINEFVDEVEEIVANLSLLLDRIFHNIPRYFFFLL